MTTMCLRRNCVAASVRSYNVSHLAHRVECSLEVAPALNATMRSDVTANFGQAACRPFPLEPF